MSSSNFTNITYNSNATGSITPNIDAAIDKAYIFMGAMAIAANGFVFVVLLSEQKLLKKSAFIFNITLSHFLGSCHMCFSGIFRRANGSHLSDQMNPWLCVAQIWTIFYGLEFQTMGCLLAVAGIERLLAVASPNWYRINWTHRISWTLSGVVFVVGFCGVGWSFYNLSQMRSVPLKCQIGAVYGVKYVAYIAAVSSFGGMVASLATVTAWLRGRKRFLAVASSTQEGKQLLKQMRLTRTMLTIAALDFFLTVPPNFMLFLSKVTYIPFSENIPYYSNIAYSINGVANVVAYLAVNGEFRRAARCLLAKFGLRSNSVVPTSLM